VRIWWATGTKLERSVWEEKSRPLWLLFDDSVIASQRVNANNNVLLCVLSLSLSRAVPGSCCIAAGCAMPPPLVAEAQLSESELVSWPIEWASVVYSSFPAVRASTGRTSEAAMKSAMGRGLEARRGGLGETSTADARRSRPVRMVSSEPEQLELASEDAQDMRATRPSRSLSDDCSSVESGFVWQEWCKGNLWRAWEY